MGDQGLTVSFEGVCSVQLMERALHCARQSAHLPLELWQRAQKGGAAMGWVNVDECAGVHTLGHIKQSAQRIREQADVLVIVGVGGSNRAARAAIQLLGAQQGMQILWAGDTLSAYEVHRLIQKLEQYVSVFVNCIAKNFATLEPGVTFRVLREYLQRRYGQTEAARRIIATGTPEGRLHQLCVQQGYDFLEFPVNVGGRYSAGTNVGLFPMAAAGIEIDCVVQGMRDMAQRLRTAPPEENPALQYAGMRHILYEQGYRLEMLSFFEPRLRGVAQWWVQQVAESEGKQGKGLYPVTACNTEDLHATGQFVQQGTPILFETFLTLQQQTVSFKVPESAQDDGFAYVQGTDFHELNEAAQRATLRAHSERGIPCIAICAARADAYTFGALLYFFLCSVAFSCSMAGVNPFDQPGVEAYKHYLTGYLKNKRAL